MRVSAPPHTPRWSRGRGATAAFVWVAATGLLGAYIVPTAALAEGSRTEEATSAAIEYIVTADDAQSIAVASDITVPELARNSYSVEVVKKVVAPPAATNASAAPAAAARPTYTGGGSPQEWMTAAGIAESDWGFVDYIIRKESGWNPNAVNKGSGACGLGQALPCGKVPGDPFNPVDNLAWATGYANSRYGGWGGAYQAWVSKGWW